MKIKDISSINENYIDEIHFIVDQSPFLKGSDYVEEEQHEEEDEYSEDYGEDDVYNEYTQDIDYSEPVDYTSYGEYTSEQQTPDMHYSDYLGNGATQDMDAQPIKESWLAEVVGVLVKETLEYNKEIISVIIQEIGNANLGYLSEGSWKVGMIFLWGGIFSYLTGILFLVTKWYEALIIGIFGISVSLAFEYIAKVKGWDLTETSIEEVDGNLEEYGEYEGYSEDELDEYVDEEVENPYIDDVYNDPSLEDKIGSVIDDETYLEIDDELTIPERFEVLRKKLGEKSIYDYTRTQRIKLLSHVLSRNYEDYKDVEEIIPDNSDQDLAIVATLYQALNDGFNEIYPTNYERQERLVVTKVEKEYNKYTVHALKPSGTSTKKYMQSQDTFLHHLKEKETDNIQLTISPLGNSLIFRIYINDVAPLLLGDIISQQEYIDKIDKKLIPICFGVTESGEPFIEDHTENPHTLISGGTGGGKSVVTASMLTQIFLLNSPLDVQAIIVDPKRTPLLRQWRNLPHVIESFRGAEDLEEILKKILEEGDRRQDWLSEYECSDYEEYLAKRKINSELPPYPILYVIIDELNSLKSEYDEDVHKKILTSIQTVVEKTRSSGIKLIGIGQRLTNKELPKTARTQMQYKLGLLLTQQQDIEFLFDEKMPGIRMAQPGDAAIKVSGDAPVFIRTTILHHDKGKHHQTLQELIKTMSYNIDEYSRVDCLEKYRYKHEGNKKKKEDEGEKEDENVYNEELEEQNIDEEIIEEKEVEEIKEEEQNVEEINSKIPSSLAGMFDDYTDDYEIEVVENEEIQEKVEEQEINEDNIEKEIEEYQEETVNEYQEVSEKDIKFITEIKLFIMRKNNEEGVTLEDIKKIYGEDSKEMQVIIQMIKEKEVKIVNNNKIILGDTRYNDDIRGVSSYVSHYGPIILEDLSERFGIETIGKAVSLGSIEIVNPKDQKPYAIEGKKDGII